MSELLLDRAAYDGVVLLPGDPEYAEGSQAHQRAVVQRPLAVVEAASVDDLRAALGAARSAGATVATQASGHGPSADLAGSILVRLTGFDTIEIDKDGGTAVVGAGVRAGDLMARLAGTGLMAPVGTSPDVSVVPLMLAGGLGWTARTVGVSAQALRRVELLRPDGSHGWVDDDSDAELMAVLRGAGGLVGIVTAVEIDLLRAAAMAGGAAGYAVDDGPVVWRAVRDAAVGDATTVMVTSMRIPDLPFLPEQIRGRSWFGVAALAVDGDLGGLEGALQAAEPLQSAWGPIDTTGIAGLTNDPREAGASLFASVLLRELPDAAIEAVLDWHRSDVGAAVVSLGARRLGGALDRPARPAVADVAGAVWVVTAVLPLAPGPDTAARAAIEALLAVLAPWTVPGAVPTFLGDRSPLAAAIGADGVARVHAVRERLGAEVIAPVRL